MTPVSNIEVSKIFLNAWTTWCWVQTLPAKCNKSDLPVINSPVFVLPEAFLAVWHCLSYDTVNGNQEENGEHLLHARLYGNEMKLMCSGVFHFMHCSMVFLLEQRSGLYSSFTAWILPFPASASGPQQSQFCLEEFYRRPLMVLTAVWSLTSCCSSGGRFSWEA